jgi:membrane-bound metal-dependent hydrolase YbcI (DUF457 family)
MTLAVTHILLPMILVDLVRDHVFKMKKQILPNKYVLIAGLAGLAPDIDIPISIFIFHDLKIHRTFTHSIWIPIALFAAFVICYYLKKKNYSKFFLMCFIGISMHIILDFYLSGYVSLFLPLSDTIYGLNILPVDQAYLIYSAIDAVLLFGWIIHEELEHKISDFF